MEIFVEYLLSMRWMWIVIGVILGYLIKRISWYLEAKDTYRQNLYIKSIKIDELINKLDKIIEDTGEEYSINVLAIKDIYYLNSKAENEMLEYMKKEVPKRIPKSLIKDLKLEYPEEYVGELIGTHIYNYILAFTISYNAEKKKG